MEQLKCRACGAPLTWDGTSDLVVCPYCGMRYHMRPAGQGGSGGVLSDGVGHGTVADIPCILQGAGGACFVRCYVPSGWKVQCGGSGQNYGDPARDGAHITTTMGAPGDKAFIVIRSGQTVRHIEPSMLNGNGRRHLNLMGATVVGGGGMEGTTRTAGEYDDEMVPAIFPGAQLELLREEDAGEEERQINAQILSAYTNQGAKASVDWKRRYYLAVLPDGKRVNAAAETRIVSYEPPSAMGQFADAFGHASAGAGQQQEAFGQHAGSFSERLSKAASDLFGGREPAGMFRNPAAGAFGNLGGLSDMLKSGAKGLSGALGNGMRRMQQALIPRFWEVQYELLFLADEDCAREMYPEFLKVRKTLQFLPAFEQFKAHERQVVLQCQQQMMADRAASQQRMMNTMQETQSYIHNVQSDMMASNAASHDRVAAQWSDYMRNSGPAAYGGGMGMSGGGTDTMDRVRNMWSETIKETNTYYGNDGKVYEASTAYDRVYQGNQDQDSFVGTEGTAWEPGVDYDELKRTNGDY